MDETEERKFTDQVRAIRFINPSEYAAHPQQRDKGTRVNKPAKRQPRTKPSRKGKK